MRKYPPVVVLNRICTKKTKLNGTDFVIPKGTHVAIPVFGIHRDSNIFFDPDKFDPERFSEENIKTRHSYTYLPFGEGPRICIGMYAFLNNSLNKYTTEYIITTRNYISTN